ncbi:hypothetical protein AKJ56_02040 [candidate division MSBL1 archaeon SCGC-AAA382N08]|uniref:Response regulatory domain-containing protein n=1 Tax=candidate division MSBL1 archaeon SCGC-AAA382N08 TaxID=1698285 RepID=A0A133VNJ1_9EURY|nr:hypothetical protein AKJ56_02040 [candidate division MSBL1 archaeon SCGC-AAA382N08]
MKILLVDDEPDFLEQTKLFLEREDERFNVSSAISAVEALDMLKKGNYDIIISDYQMPKMDGIDFLETLRKEKSRDLPFILFTGKGREEVAMKALNLGADRYLQKGGDVKSQYGVLTQAIIQEAEHWFTKKRLSSSEKKYKDLTEKALVGVYIMQNDVFKYVNPKFCDIFEYEREELIDKEYLELVAQEDRELVKNGVSKRERGKGEKTQYKFKGLKSTGETVTIQVLSVPSEYNGKPSVQGTLIKPCESSEKMA